MYQMIKKDFVSMLEYDVLNMFLRLKKKSIIGRLPWCNIMDIFLYDLRLLTL